MATTMTSPPPAPVARTAPGTRFVNVRADLLPAEIVSKRQTEVVRRQVVLGLCVVVVLLVAWFGVTWWQTEAADGDLSDAQQQTHSFQQQVASFGPLVTMQNQTQALEDELHKLLTGNLSWHTMLTTLRGVAPAGVSLTSVAGTINTGTTTTTPAVQPVLNQTGKQAVGQLTLAGTADSLNAVAAYADKLASVPGIATPRITSIAAGDHARTWGITAIITSDAAASTGGH